MDAYALLQIVSRDAAARIAVILESPEFVVASLDEASRAVDDSATARRLRRLLSGGDQCSAGCATTATFDRDALKSGEPFAAVPTRA